MSLLNHDKNYNIGYILTDHPDDATCLYYIEDESIKSYSFKEIKQQAKKIANFISGQGQAGNIISVMMSPSPELLETILGIYMASSITLSMSPLFGKDAVEYRLKASGSRILFTDNPNMKANITVGTGFGNYEFSNLSNKYNTPVKKMDDNYPIQLFYTSGSTGYPKGVILPQSFLFSHVEGFSTYFETPARDDITVAFADWGWIGALGDVILPSLYSGIPTVAYRISTKFSLEKALEILSLSKATCAFIPPSFLGKLIKEKPSEMQNNNIRVIASGGGTVPNFVYDWGRGESIEINEFYGQTEANILCSNSSKKRKLGSAGIPLPSHKVEIMDSSGLLLPPNMVGEIVLKLPDPVAFLRYLGNSAETGRKKRGDWLHTGDLGMFDDDGFLWFKGRNDYLIKTNAWRVGPEEVENVIARHEAVKDVAVCGVKDIEFGQKIRAYIVLNEGYEQSSVLENEIIQMVKENLSRYSYPREFVYVKEIPRTESGKIKRNELGR